MMPWCLCKDAAAVTCGAAVKAAVAEVAEAAEPSQQSKVKQSKGSGDTQSKRSLCASFHINLIYSSCITSVCAVSFVVSRISCTPKESVGFLSDFACFAPPPSPLTPAPCRTEQLMELLDLSDQLEYILNQVYDHHLLTLFTLFDCLD